MEQNQLIEWMRDIVETYDRNSVEKIAEKEAKVAYDAALRQISDEIRATKYGELCKEFSKLKEKENGRR